MEVRAISKHVRISHKKAREVAREIQGLPVGKALEMLRFIPRKSARLLAKTLHSAIANAENNHNLPPSSLIISRAIVDRGPVLKRFKAGARGSAKPIQKPTSHLRIVLTEATVRQP